MDGGDMPKPVKLRLETMKARVKYCNKVSDGGEIESDGDRASCRMT